MTTSESDLFSATSTKERKTSEQANAVGSSFGGNTVTIASGQDIHVKGSSVISDTGTTLAAGRNLTIEAAQNTSSSTSFYEKKESGLLDSGGAGITIGSREQSTDQKNRRTSAAASTVGSIGGNVTLIAGEQYRQVGSDVLAPGGNINILAKKVDIVEARETNATQTEQKFKQAGLTVALSSPLISAAQTIDGVVKTTAQTSNSRDQALALATGALAAKNAVDAVALNPAQAGGINLSISLGSSRSQSNSSTSSDTAKGSTVAAGGNVNVTATGADSNLLIQGSSVKADGNTTLAADNQVDLIAARNASSQNGTNSNSSGSLGVSVGFGNSNGLSVTASVSKGSGTRDGQDISYTNTQVNAGNTLTIQSGGDTNIKGATAAGKTVIADIGGNLNIESLQDSSTLTAKDRSSGGSIGIPIGAGTFNISANVGKTDINSTFQSVTQQSGIRAGDGGFDIVVKNNTDLKGAVITSTQAAIDNNKNSLITGSLSTSDIQNKAEYSGQSVNLGVSYSGEQKDADGNSVLGKDGKPIQTGYNGFNGTPPVALNANGSASSTTSRGISAGSILITDEDAQKAKTGQDASTTVARINWDVNTDKDTTNALKPIFNEQEIRAGFAIVGAFAKEVGTFLDNRAKEADAIKIERDAALRTGDESTVRRLNAELGELEKWAPNGDYRMATTALAGAFSGNVTGNSGQIVQSAVVNYIQSLGVQEIGRVADSLGSEPARAALQGLAGCAGAVVQGADCGAGALGASAGVLVNALLEDGSSLSAQAKEARRNMITSLVAALASSSGNVSTAVTATAIETENNALSLRGSGRLMNTLRLCEGSNAACNIDALREDTLRDTKVQNQRIADACSGAGANLNNCMSLSNTANQTAMNLLNATIYADTPEKRQLLQDLIAQQVNDMEALSRQLDTTLANASFKDTMLANASFKDTMLAGLQGVAQVLTMAGVKAKESRYSPNAGGVGNMKEFFGSSGFGTQLADATRKTSKIFQGKSVYIAKTDVGETIRKGDQVYLDGAHKNHLEVFDSKGNFKTVLNLDGSENLAKKEAAGNRSLPK